MKIIFRCDGSSSCGMGHLMRCLVLAEEFRKRANKVLFAAAKAAAAADLLRKNKFPVLWLHNKDGFINESAILKLRREKADLLVIDSYEASEELLDLMNKNFKKTAIFDDNAKLNSYNVDCIINGNIFACEAMYKGRDNKTKLLLGNRFTVLGKDFLKNKKSKIKEKAENILITFGGSDPEKQTVRLLKLLSSFSHNFKVRVIVGGFYKGIKDLKRHAEKCRFGVRILKNVGNMSVHMRWADLAVSGAGTTAYELACTGTPALLIVLADNQKSVAEKLHKEGAAHNLGYYKDISDNDIKEKIINLALDYKKRKKMSQIGKSLFKENGAKNIADSLLQKDTQKSYFCKASKKDIIKEYKESAEFNEDYKKAKWGSREGMLNRFKLFKNTVNWEKVKSWLDIGCANGVLFEHCGSNNVKCVGVDICADLVEEAGKKYKILAGDAEKLPFKDASFDLVSAIGLLQKCGAEPERILAECLRVLKKKGQLFFTTKNALWDEFTSGNLKPYKKHNWFAPQNIKNILLDLEARIIKMEGFLPKKGLIVPIEKSHSFYVLAENG